MKFEILCNRGLKEVQLGESRETVRSALPFEYESSRAQAWHTVDTDYYDKLGFSLSYDDQYHLKVIMLHSHVKIYFHGSSLERKDKKKLSRKLKHFGYESENYEGVVFYDSIGLAIHAEANAVIACELYTGRYRENYDHAYKLAVKYHGL